MKKNYLMLLALAFVGFTGIAGAQINSWNISDDNFNALGSMVAKTTVDGLTIFAADGKNVDVDANGKSVTYNEVKYTYTHRLKFGGIGAFDEAGLPLNRALGFDVSGPCNITVMCMSSSSGTDRILNMAAGSNTNVISEIPALGSPLTATTVAYTGEATTIYLWSPSSGVNLYHILVEEATSTSIQTPTASGSVVSTEYFSINGIKMGSNFDVLPSGIYIQLEQYSDGSVDTKKIVKNIR